METEGRAHIDENGRVAIPASFLNAGDQVVLRIKDDELRITTLKRRLERAQGLVRRD